MSPEKLISASFFSLLQKGDINLFAIDETKGPVPFREAPRSSRPAAMPSTPTSSNGPGPSGPGRVEFVILISAIMMIVAFGAYKVITMASSKF